MEYHWKRLSEMQTMAFAQLAARLEAGDLGYERSSANVLLEITLAQALELRNQEAALMFETEYIPFVTSIARRLGGQRAVDVFDNFTAELILPRADSSPRISGYHGRTSLRSWLRAVVANLWVSRQRKREAVTLNVLPEPEVADPTATLDHRPCVQLLRPLFRQAVGQLEAEDRLLIKMLLIDEVPQKELAESLGIHSGNLTRRNSGLLPRYGKACSKWHSQPIASVRPNNVCNL